MYMHIAMSYNDCGINCARWTDKRPGMCRWNMRMNSNAFSATRSIAYAPNFPFSSYVFIAQSVRKMYTLKLTDRHFFRNFFIYWFQRFEDFYIYTQCMSFSFPAGPDVLYYVEYIKFEPGHVFTRQSQILHGSHVPDRSCQQRTTTCRCRNFS